MDSVKMKWARSPNHFVLKCRCSLPSYTASLSCGWNDEAWSLAGHCHSASCRTGHGVSAVLEDSVPRAPGSTLLCPCEVSCDFVHSPIGLGRVPDSRLPLFSIPQCLSAGCQWYLWSAHLKAFAQWLAAGLQAGYPLFLWESQFIFLKGLALTAVRHTPWQLPQGQEDVRFLSQIREPPSDFTSSWIADVMIQYSVRCDTAINSVGTASYQSQLYLTTAALLLPFSDWHVCTL